MRIATWNIEWFANLFDMNDTLQADGEWSARHNVTRETQADAIAFVIEKIDADVLMIIEAPNTGHTQSSTRALEAFTATYGLRQSSAVSGFPSETQQEISAIFDPAVATLRHDPLESIKAPRFDASFQLDVDVDAQPDTHVFSKPPLELELTYGQLPQPLRLIGVHAKSKAPHAARDEDHATQISIANRRKQLAQCVWLRARIDEMLAAKMPLLVMGDLNDGPGLDHYEKLFGRSSVEVVLGDPDVPETVLIDPHAAAWLNPRQGWSLSTARFYHRDFRRYVNALLDYMMVSQDLVATMKPRWRIWHPFDDPRIYKDEGLREALIAASDHYPVSIDLG